MHMTDISPDVLSPLRRGTMIAAHPLALKHPELSGDAVARGNPSRWLA